MNLKKAWEHATNAANIMGEKSRESGFDQSNTAAGQLCLAIAALLTELGKEPQNYQPETKLARELREEIASLPPIPTTPPGKWYLNGVVDTRVPQEPGVYSVQLGNINPVGGGTSPFRHWQAAALAPAAAIAEEVAQRFPADMDSVVYNR